MQATVMRHASAQTTKVEIGVTEKAIICRVFSTLSLHSTIATGSVSHASRSPGQASIDPSRSLKLTAELLAPAIDDSS